MISLLSPLISDSPAIFISSSVLVSEWLRGQFFLVIRSWSWVIGGRGRSVGGWGRSVGGGGVGRGNNGWGSHGGGNEEGRNKDLEWNEEL